MGMSHSGRELIAIIEPDGGYALDWQYVSRGDGQQVFGGQQVCTGQQVGGVEQADIEIQQDLYDAYMADRDLALLKLGTIKRTAPFSETVEYLSQIASAFVKCLSENPDLETLRDVAKAVLEPEEPEKLLAQAPFIIGSEHLNADWIVSVWDKLNGAFSDEIKKFRGTVAEYFINKNPDIHIAGKVYFHLVESNKADYPFAFLATYSAEPSSTGKGRHLPLKNALMEYGLNSQKLLELLSTVNRAAQYSPFVSGLLNTGEIFHPIGLYPDEAYTFLKEVPIYESAGILCRIPNWWRKKTGSPKISINIGNKEPSRVGMDALVDFDVQLSLGGETITPEELRRLMSETEGLAFIKGRWVEIDPERLRETLAAYEHAQKEAQRGELTMMEAMRLQLSAEKLVNIDEKVCEVEVSNGGARSSRILEDADTAAMFGIDIESGGNK